MPTPFAEYVSDNAIRVQHECRNSISQPEYSSKHIAFFSKHCVQLRIFLTTLAFRTRVGRVSTERVPSQGYHKWLQSGFSFSLTAVICQLLPSEQAETLYTYQNAAPTFN